MDDFTLGYKAAEQARQSGIDVLTHRSQGDSDFDHGWNAYLDELEKSSEKGVDYAEDK